MTRLFFIISLGLLVAGSLYGLSTDKHLEKDPYPVSVTPVTQETIQSDLRVMGRLTSSRKQVIQGKGLILPSHVYVREGMFVKKGQPIAEIARNEEMEKLLSDYGDAQIEAKISKEAWDVAKELRARGAIPENQFQEAELRYKKAEATNGFSMI